MRTWQQQAGPILGKSAFVTPEELGRDVCESCGQMYRLLTLPCVGGPNAGEPIVWRNGCLCGNINLAKQTLEADKKARALWARKQFEQNSIISKNLQRCTLDNYNPLHHTQEYALAVARRLVDGFHSNMSFNCVLHGPYGVGKSHLAYGICNGLMERGFITVYISLPELQKLLRDAYDKKGEEMKLYNLLRRADFLVIDELGGVPQSKWTDDILLAIFEGRAGRVTMYTSNYGREELRRWMNPRNFSKFSFDLKYFEVDGQDYRQEGGRINA